MKTSFSRKFHKKKSVGSQKKLQSPKMKIIFIAIFCSVQSSQIFSRIKRDAISMNRYINNGHVTDIGNQFGDHLGDQPDLMLQTIMELRNRGKSGMVKAILQKLGQVQEKRNQVKISQKIIRRNNGRLRRFRSHHRPSSLLSFICSFEFDYCFLRFFCYLKCLQIIWK